MVATEDSAAVHGTNPLHVRAKQSDAGAKQPSRLLARLRDKKTAERLSATLPGQPLPEVELTTSDAARVSLCQHISGLVVLYFTPGENGGTASVEGLATPDAAQHRGYIERAAYFTQLNARIFCISSQRHEALRQLADEVGVRHFMLSDPELVVGQALDLPTAGDIDIPRYRRVVLVANDGLIERPFGPLPDSEAAGSAHQVLTWLQATR